MQGEKPERDHALAAAAVARRAPHAERDGDEVRERQRRRRERDGDTQAPSDLGRDVDVRALELAAEVEREQAVPRMRAAPAECAVSLRSEVERPEEVKVLLPQRSIEQMLLPKDPRDDRGVIMEIRAGAGGGEAALFVGDLLRMYMRYAERRGWKSEVLSSSPTGIGGFKEAAIGIQGRGAYSRLKYESGSAD